MGDGPFFCLSACGLVATVNGYRLRSNQSENSARTIPTTHGATISVRRSRMTTPPFEAGCQNLVCQTLRPSGLGFCQISSVLPIMA
uniref:Uncharacterized protein n=1 Tax=Lacticaseibacillus paracasei TaxID=1597 RepID=R9WSI3_LACPA|nr:hypothetical protein [Lacticaseibacillus paracasei]